MPKFSEKREVPYTPDQMFDLVADIKRYPDFLPWVVGARAKKQTSESVWAELIVGYKMFRERFSCRVDLKKKERVIDVEYLHGPLKHLVTHWKFDPKNGGTEVDFMVDFEFRNKLFERMMGRFFSEAVTRMSHAFEHRARELYGKD